MTKRVTKMLFTAVLTIVFLIPVLFTAPRFANTAASISIPNGDFKSNSFSIQYGCAIPTNWIINEFVYDSQSTTLSCSIKNEKIETSNNVSLSEGFYVLTAKTNATGLGIKIKLSYGTTEQEFDLSEGANESSVYFYTNGSSAKVSLRITEINGGLLTVNEILLTESAAKVETEEGASIRAQINGNGIRFRGRVDKITYDKMIEQFGKENVEAGIIIVPTDYLTDNVEFTIDGLKEKSPLIIAAEKWNNADTAEQDGYYGFNCAMTDIYPENTDRKFSARAYVKYSTGNTEKYSYAEYDEAKHSRSIYEVATKASKELGISSEMTEIITAYLERINIRELKEDDFTENGNSLTINLSYSGEGVLKTEIAESNNITITVKENGTKITSKKGYYKITDYTNIELTYTYNSFGLNIYQPLTLKYYFY